MANHLGVRLLARGRKVIVQKESHLFRDEGDCAQRLSGLNLIPLAAGKAAFAPGEIEEEVEQAEQGRVVVPVGAISIESPVRRRDGEVVPFEQMRQIAEFARKRDIGLHLDGARLYMASAYTGVTPAQYAALFDTVFVSVSKYFNSSFGAVLAGSRKLLEGAFHDRRMLGGGLPHVWTEAAVALHYLDQFEDRYHRAKQAGDTLLSTLAANKGMEVRRVTPGSNIAFVRTRLKDPQAFVKGMRNAGVAIGAARSTNQPGLVDVQVTVNETLLRRPVSEIASAFAEQAGAA
jgi:threonine aldolase